MALSLYAHFFASTRLVASTNIAPGYFSFQEKTDRIYASELSKIFSD
jgi:hypothetical protein